MTQNAQLLAKELLKLALDEKHKQSVIDACHEVLKALDSSNDSQAKETKESK